MKAPDATTPHSHALGRRRVRPWLLVSLLAAAVAVWFGQRSSAVDVTRLDLVPYPEPTEQTESGVTVPQSWIARLSLAEDGYPLLVHVDADGWPVILFPENRWIAWAADRDLLLPDPTRGVSWAWPASDESSTVLAAATRRASLDLEKLRETLQREASRAPSASEAQLRVREILERSVGPVREAHRPGAPSVRIAGQT